MELVAAGSGLRPMQATLFRGTIAPGLSVFAPIGDPRPATEYSRGIAQTFDCHINMKCVGSVHTHANT